MIPQTCTLFLAVAWLSISGSYEAKPELIFSSNVTSVVIGNSIKLTCKLENFAPEKEFYDVLFYRDGYFFCYYFIKAPDSSGQRLTTFYNQSSTQPSLGRHPLSSTFPIYEITVTPTISGTEEYWCKLAQNTPPLNVNSNNHSLTATPLHPPSALLSSNVSSPLPDHPFTLSCTFTNFNPIPVKYSVAFNSQRDGQLAVYDVHNGTTILSEAISETVDVSQGPRSAYPNFDLLITEKMNTSSAYWCVLEEEGKALVKSNTWPLAANFTLQFTASKPAENQRAATCSVDDTDLDPIGKTYTVQFLSDFGPKKVNLLAEYISKPNQKEEFKAAHLASWGSIHYGASTVWPNFSILATGTGSLHGSWWCVLAMGAQGTPEYREITSQRVTL